MKKRLFTILSILLLTCIFLSCNHDVKKDTVSEETFTDDIIQNQSFDEKTVYLNHEVYITDGVTVTCTDSTFKFGPKGSLTVKAGATLIATQTVFTSVNDDENGSIIKTSSGTPNPDDWIGVIVDGGTAEFLKCTFMYGGKEYKSLGHYSVLYSKKDSGSNKGPKGKMKIEECTFAYNGGKSDEVNGTAAVTFGQNAAPYDATDNYVKNSTFKNNLWPLSIPTDFSMPDSSNVFEDNKYQGIYVEYDNERTIGHNATSTTPALTTWAYQTVPYCYMHEGYDLKINANGTLYIKGGNSSASTEILVYKKGIEISDVNGQATLKLGDYIIFDSYNHSTQWSGIVDWDGTKYSKFYTSNTDKHVYILNSNQTEGDSSAVIGDENH